MISPGPPGEPLDRLPLLVDGAFHASVLRAWRRELRGHFCVQVDVPSPTGTESLREQSDRSPCYGIAYVSHFAITFSATRDISRDALLIKRAKLRVAARLRHESRGPGRTAGVCADKRLALRTAACGAISAIGERIPREWTGGGPDGSRLGRRHAAEAPDRVSNRAISVKRCASPGRELFFHRRTRFEWRNDEDKRLSPL